MEWNYIERREILERCHQAWERNPLANSAVTYTTQFSIGDGGTFTYFSQEVKEVLQEFINNPENNFKAYEKEFCDALQVDGEIFVRFFHDAQGRTLVVPLRPWHVQWIATDKDFYQRKLSYHYVYAVYKDEPTQVQYGEEDIDAKEVLHLAINKMPYELRGRPELFRVLPWLRAYKEWLEDRARINKRKGSLLYDVTLKNARSDQVASKQAQYGQPPSSGSLIIHNDNEVWQVLSARIEAGDAAEDGRQFKMMFAAGQRLPEYFFADGQNASLGSAKAQQLPALRKFTNFQDILVEQCWMPIFKRVIQAAIDSGRIKEYVQQIDSNGKPVLITSNETGGMPDMGGGMPPNMMMSVRESIEQGAVPKMIKAIDAFEYKYPDLEASDPQTLAAALAIMVQNGWVSKSTATSQLGFDPSKEKENIKREKDADTQEQVDQAALFAGLFNPINDPNYGQNMMGQGMSEMDDPFALPSLPPLGGQNPNQNPSTVGKEPIGEQK